MSSMAGITLEQAQTQLATYLAAETKTLTSQEYRIADRLQKRALLSDIRAGIDEWNARVQSLSNAATGRSRCRTISPL